MNMIYLRLFAFSFVISLLMIKMVRRGKTNRYASQMWWRDSFHFMIFILNGGKNILLFLLNGKCRSATMDVNETKQQYQQSQLKKCLNLNNLGLHFGRIKNLSDQVCVLLDFVFSHSAKPKSEYFTDTKWLVENLYLISGRNNKTALFMFQQCEHTMAVLGCTIWLQQNEIYTHIYTIQALWMDVSMSMWALKLHGHTKHTINRHSNSSCLKKKTL